MRCRILAAVLAACLWWLAPVFLSAAEAGDSPAASPERVNPYPADDATVTGTGGNSASTAFPVKPYGEAEFPDWLKKVRRFEVIAIGSFPLAYLNSNLFFDVGRWGYYLATNDAGNAALYQPLFFAPPNKPGNSLEQNLGIVLSSIGVSLAVAVIDLIIGLVEEDQARLKAAAVPPAAAGGVEP